MSGLLAQLDRKIDLFVGDGIYDQEAVYEAMGHHSPGAENGNAQKREAVIGCAILKRMLEMGEASSYVVG